MSTVDERVVILEFNNAQFESGVKQSVSTLQNLKNALNLEDSAKGLNELQAAGKSFSLSNVADNIQTVTDRFSVMGIIGDQVIRRLTNTVYDFGKSLLTAIPNQMVSGGKRRAQNIEHAQFMLKGLLQDAYDWKTISEDLNYGVQDTAYGLDEAAAAAAQLSASSVQFGDEMKAALRGISGVAAMSGDSYTEIANIFTKIAGQGRVMTQELNQFAAHGLNVAATMANEFGVTEAEIREMVHDGQIGFMDFAYAMDNAFGEHAKRANETFSGALSNVKASLSRMGAQFATPAYDNLRLMLVELIPVLKKVETLIKPISAAFTVLAETISTSVIGALRSLDTWLGLFVGKTNDVVSNGWFHDFGDIVHNTVSDIRQGLVNSQISQMASFGSIRSSITRAAENYKQQASFLYQVQNTIGKNVEAGLIEKKNLSEKTQEALEAGDTGKYLKDLHTQESKAIDEAIYKASELIRRGADQASITDQLLDTLSSIRGEVDAVENLQFKMGEDTVEIVDAVSEVREEANSLFGDLEHGYNAFAAQVYFGENPFDAILQNFSTLDADVEKRNDELRRKRKQEKALAEDDTAVADYINETEVIAKSMKVATGYYDKAINGIHTKAAELIKSGKNVNAVRAMEQDAINKVTGQYEDYMHYIGDGQQKETLEEKIARKKQEIYDKTSNTLKNLSHGFLKLIGLEQEETSVVGESADAQGKLQELTEQVINGDYGNGQDRINKFLEIYGNNGVYKLVQNNVNKLLGCEKEHVLSLEEETEAWASLGAVTAEQAEQQEVVHGAIEKVSIVIASIGAALGLVKEVALSFFKEVLIPFMQWGIPRLLNFILTPLSFIGDKIVSLYTSIQANGGLAAYFASFREKIAEFWRTLKELEGVKKLQEAWDKLKTTFKDLWDNAVSKVTGGFASLKENLKLPEADFFLNIVDKLTTGLSNFVGWIGDRAIDVGGFFSPIFDWLVALPPKIQGFWESIGGFEGVKAYFKPLTDWFKGVGDSIVGFWNKITGKGQGENGEDIPGVFAPIVDWFDRLKTKFTNFIEEAKKFDNIKDLFDWLISTVKTKLSNFWASLWGNGEAEDGATGIAGAFENVKNKISAFMDSIAPLKALKNWLKGIFNENLINSIKDIGAAIGEFFETLFGKSEEGENGEALGTFSERFVEGAKTLVEKLKEIFSTNGSGLLTLLLGGSLLTKFGLMFGLFNKIKKTGGIGEVIYGKARGGLSLPKIAAMILGLGSAIALLGGNAEEAGEKTQITGNVFIDTWNMLKRNISGIFKFIQDKNIFGSLYDLIFGSKEEGENGKQNKGLLKRAKDSILWVFNQLQTFINSLTGGGIGFEKATALISGGVLLAGIVFFVQTIIRVLGMLAGIKFNVTGVLTDVRMALQAYQTEIYSNLLIKIATAVLMLVGAIIALSFVPPDRLKAATDSVIQVIFLVGAIATIIALINRANLSNASIGPAATAINVFVAALGRAFGMAARMVGIGLVFIGLAAAIGAIAKAIQRLIDIGDAGKIDKAVHTIYEIMAVLALFGVLMAGFAKFVKGPGIGGFGLAFIGLAVAMLAFTKILKDIQDVSFDYNKIAAIIGSMSLMLIAMGALGAGAAGVNAFALGSVILSMSLGLMVFANACETLSKIKWYDIIVPLISLGLAILMFIGAAKALNGIGLAGLGAALAGFGGGILMLSGALVLLGTYSDIAVKGVVGLIGVFTVLFAFLGLLKVLHLDTVFAMLGTSMLAFAAAMGILGLSIPLFTYGISGLGDMLEKEAPKMWHAVGMIAVMMLALGTAAAIGGKHMLTFGKGLLYAAAAIALLVGLFTGFKAFKELFESFGDNVLSIGKNVSNGFSSMFSNMKSNASELPNILKGLNLDQEKTASVKLNTALKGIDNLPETARTEIAKKMEELRTMDGSEYSIGLQGVIEYIQSLNLDEETTKDTIRATVWSAVDMSEEDFTVSVINLKTHIEGILDDPKEREDFFKLLEDTINAGPIGEFGIKLRDLRSTVDNLQIPDESKQRIKKLIEEGALANAKYKLALKNIEAILSNYGMPISTYNDIQSFIDGFVANQTFSVTMENIKAIIGENASASMTIGDHLRLRSLIEDAATAGASYNITVATLKVALEEEGITISDTEWDKVQKEIDELGTLAAQESETDSEGVTVETRIDKLKVKVHDFLFMQKGPDGAQYYNTIDKLVEDAINKKKNYEIALKNVRLKLGSGTDENGESGLGWSEDAITALEDEIKKLAEGDPENPYEAQLKKIWLSCSDYEMTTQSKLDLMTEIANGLEEAMREKFLLDSLELSLGEAGVSEDTANQIRTKMQELLGSGVTEADALYTELVNYIRENVTTEEQGTALGLVDQVVNEAGNTTVAKLTKIGLEVEDVEFATNAARDYWVGRVQELLSIARGENGPVDLPVAIGQFLMDFEQSAINEADKATVKAACDEIINAWDSYYQEGYAAIYERQQAARKMLLGGAYAYDQSSGMYIIANTKLAKAWDTFWTDHDYDKDDPEALKKAWEEFSDYLYAQGIGKKEFIESVGGVKLEEAEDLYDKIFPAEGTWGSNPHYLQETFGQMTEDLKNGTSDLNRYLMRNEGRIDFTKLLFGDAETDYAVLQNYTDDFYNGLKDVIITDTEGNLMSIDEAIRKEYGKDEYSVLSMEEIIGFLFSDDPGHYYARTQLEQYGYAKQILDAIEQALWGGITPEELGKESPIIEKQMDTEMQEAYQYIWTSLNDAQKQFIEDMMVLMNPKNIQELPSYLEWLEQALAEWGLTDSKGNSLSLNYLFQKMLEEENFDPYAELVKYLSYSAQAEKSKTPQYNKKGELIPEELQTKSPVGSPSAHVSYEGLMNEFPYLEYFYNNLNSGIDKNGIPTSNKDKVIADVKAQIEEAAKEVEESAEETGAEAESPVQVLLDKWAEEKISDEEFRAAIGELPMDQMAQQIAQMYDMGMPKENIISAYKQAGLDAGSNYFAGLYTGGEQSSDQFLSYLNRFGVDANGILPKVWDERSPSHITEEYGGWYIEGVAIGMYKKATMVFTAIKIIANRCLDILKNHTPGFAEKGATMSQALASGITSQIGSAIYAASDLARSTIQAIREQINGIEEVGRNFGDGYVRGVRDRVEDAYQAGAELAKAAESGNRDESKTQSPSRVAIGLGNYFGMGYVIGMDQFGKKVHDSAAGLASEAINTLRNPLQIVQDVLNSDLDTDPTIRPVMDLSQIQNGVKNINSMMPDTEYSLGYISSSMNRAKTTNADVVAAISGLSDQMANAPGGNTYNVNGITYDDGTNISEAVQSLVRAARVERRR